jgi:sarcosine oxidase subunit alpha
MVSVTEQWAQIAVAGPYARQLLERVVDPSLDLSNGAFPFLSAATTVIGASVPARLFRLSFSGELGYELAFPARFGAAVLDLLMSRGADLGVLPYGTEALGVLRIEKGHVSGPEINGQTTADDLGMGRLRSAKKDFVGRFMAARPRLTDAMRPAIVGFRPVDRSARLAAGAHFVPAGGPASADVDQGYMTSVAWSPTLGHWIGIGLLANGPQRLREIVRACDPVRGGDVLVEVCEPAFVDPSGERARG